MWEFSLVFSRPVSFRYISIHPYYHFLHNCGSQIRFVFDFTDSVLIGTSKMQLSHFWVRIFWLSIISSLRFAFRFFNIKGVFRLIVPRAVSLRTVSRVLQYNADFFSIVYAIGFLYGVVPFRILPVHWYHLL